VKDHKHPSHVKRNIVLLLLLAVVCVAGAELVACRHFDPELYRRITAPARQAVHTVEEWGRGTAQQLSRLWEQAGEYLAERFAPPEPPPEEPPAPEQEQVAQAPVLTTTTPLADPVITELVEEDNQELLLGGFLNIVYFNQGEQPWADQPYGKDNIGRYGCGPTAMAMAVASMTEEETDPALMAEWCVQHGYWASRHGSYLSIVQGVGEAFGLTVEPLSITTSEELYDVLLSKKLVVALMGPGHFTSGGHFILLRGTTLAGEVLVADPNSVERSLTTWDPQLILDEVSKSTANGAPLWALSLEQDSIS